MLRFLIEAPSSLLVWNVLSLFLNGRVWPGEIMEVSYALFSVPPSPVKHSYIHLSYRVRKGQTELF